VLEKERDRLTKETDAAKKDAGRAATEGQKYIDALTAQVNQLAATSAEQTKHIKVLEKERDRLTKETEAAKKDAGRAATEGQKHIDALTAQVKQLAATSAEQTRHIKVLEAERDRLTAEAGAAQREAFLASKEGQRHLDALKAQLDQLAATSREQSGYIGILEKEQHRLSAELAELRQKAAHYVAVMKEQGDYIKMLEVVRDQNADERS
jgi:chromosome segregation ATPase